MPAGTGAGSGGPILKPSPRRWLGVLAISLGFVGIGILLPAEGDAFWFVNVAGVVFFGLCALVALAQFVPGWNGLALEPHGFVIRSLWRRHRVAWAEIEGAFRVVRMGGRKRMVGFDLGAERAQGGLARFNKASYDIHGALPDTYGMAAEALADVMNRHLDAWRRR